MNKQARFEPTRRYQFSQSEIAGIGSWVYRRIQQNWRFGDAFDVEAHQRMIYKSKGDGRYEILKNAVEKYCRTMDYFLTSESIYRPRRNKDNYLPFDKNPGPRHRNGRLKPGIETEVPEDQYELPL